MLGKTILNYTIIRALDAGGMGSVFLAEHTLLKHLVVVKVLLPKYLLNANVVHRFFQEAKILTLLNHPNIVRLVNFAEDSTEGYILLMDYVEGKTLSAYQADFPNHQVPLETVLVIFKQLLDAFTYAHGQKVVHRDIKPNNIVITPQGQPIVLDFGIAKLKESHLTVLTQMMGTPIYMSPEQILTPKDLDQRSDIYTLGVILYELLTGKLPYKDLSSQYVLMQEILGTILPPVPVAEMEIAEPLNAVLAKATAKNRNQRYDNCAEFKADLQKIIIRLEAQKQRQKPSEWALFLNNLPPNERAEAELAEQEAIKRIQDNKNATHLNLSGAKLRRIPEDIKNLKCLTNLYLSDNPIRDISILRELKQLTKLYLGNNQIRDISILRELKQLTVLYLYNNQLRDVSALQELKQLTELYLCQNQISDVSALQELKQLTILSLHSNQISDISALQELKQLTYLNLSFNQKISDVSALRELKSLKYMRLDYNKISDISVLRELTQLISLNLGSNTIREISALRELKQLTDLALYQNQIHDVSALRELKQLTTLSLGYNQIHDISALRELKQLTTLSLAYNQISDISPLRELKQLTLLSLQCIGVPIRDLSMLQELKHLTVLFLSQNQISNIAAIGLLHLKNLTRLDLDLNQISDISALRELKQLTFLNLKYNKIQNFNLDLSLLPNLEGLYLYGNPIQNVPKEIIGNSEWYNCAVALREYQKNVKK